MRSCFTSRSLHSASLPPSEDQRNSAAETPTSSAKSATVNLSREFAKAVHSSSYNEIWSKIHFVEAYENGDVNQQQQFFAQVLQPNHTDIQEALQYASSNPFTEQISTYIAHTEQVCHLLFTLNEGINHARSLYAPIQELVSYLPSDSDSLTHSQCDSAYDIFIQFETKVNPFSCPGCNNNFSEMQHCFSDLKDHIDNCINKFKSRVRMIRFATTGSAVCLIGTVVGLAITVVSIAGHALIALAAGSLLPQMLPKLMKKDIARIALLDSASRSAYVLHNDLQTVDRLARHLQTAVEGDKSLARLGIGRGKEWHPINEVAKRLAKNHHNVQLQLADLEKHICLCFAAINRARSLLLHEIQFHQNS
ncbi:hypothetical protein V2J09_005138 [Rumex salicifolius]